MLAKIRSILNGEDNNLLLVEDWAAKYATCCRSVSLRGSKSPLAKVFNVQKGIFLIAKMDLLKVARYNTSRAPNTLPLY